MFRLSKQYTGYSDKSHAELLAENLYGYKIKCVQCFPFDMLEVAISIRSIFAALWLLACGIWLGVATFQQGLLPWDAFELQLEGSDLLRYFLTPFVVSLPAALLLCGRYNHGVRDGMLLLILVLLISFAAYTHQERSTSLTVEQTGCIVMGVGTA